MARFEAGKTYRTRNGLVAKVHSIDYDRDRPIWADVTLPGGSLTMFTYFADGTWFIDGQSDYDLVVEADE